MLNITRKEIKNIEIAFYTKVADRKAVEKEIKIFFDQNGFWPNKTNWCISEWRSFHTSLSHKISKLLEIQEQVEKILCFYNKFPAALFRDKTPFFYAKFDETTVHFSSKQTFEMIKAVSRGKRSMQKIRLPVRPWKDNNGVHKMYELDFTSNEAAAIVFLKQIKDYVND